MSNREKLIEKSLVLSTYISIFCCIGISDYSCGFLFAFLMIWEKSKTRHEATFIFYVLTFLMIYDVFWWIVHLDIWYYSDSVTDAW